MAFLISRYLFKDLIKEQISHSQWLMDNFNIIDDILKTEGTMIVALLRMTFAPFGITSYIMGVSSIHFCDFMLGNCAYILMICAQCFIGCSLYIAVSAEGDKKN